MAETLRLEIEPFGVKTVQVVTGAVKSKGQTYFKDWKLPENSLYRSVEEVIAIRARGGDGHPREDTEMYAKDVVDDILSGKTGKIWRGGNALSTKHATTSDVPQSLLVSSTRIKMGTCKLNLFIGPRGCQRHGTCPTGREQSELNTIIRIMKGIEIPEANIQFKKHFHLDSFACQWVLTYCLIGCFLNLGIKHSSQIWVTVNAMNCYSNSKAVSVLSNCCAESIYFPAFDPLYDLRFGSTI